MWKEVSNSLLNNLFINIHLSMQTHLWKTFLSCTPSAIDGLCSRRQPPPIKASEAQCWTQPLSFSPNLVSLHGSTSSPLGTHRGKHGCCICRLKLCQGASSTIYCSEFIFSFFIKNICLLELSDIRITIFIFYLLLIGIEFWISRSFTFYKYNLKGLQATLASKFYNMLYFSEHLALY